MPRIQSSFVVLTIAIVTGAMPPRLLAQVAQPTGYTVIRSQYIRLPFPLDIVRLAVGDEAIASAELVNNREVLVLGRETGRTTLILWFSNGTVRSFTITVQRDLSVLQAALRSVHPSIQVESAPDRDALVLTGRVPTIAVSQAAESIARNYLDAGQSAAAARAFLAIAGGAIPGAQPGAPAAPQAPAPPAGQPTPPAGAPPAPVPPTGLQGPVPAVGAVINLIQLETLPPLPEDKIREAIASIGGAGVTIRRVLRGNVRDDAQDTLVLQGTVPNQVTLIRVLEIASRLFTGEAITDEDVRVIADESGALARAAQNLQGQTGLGGAGTTGGFGLGGALSLFGGGGSRVLSNQVQRNLARATAIQAGERILSFITVADLPQIRVDIRLIEVNRTKLRSFNPESALVVSSLYRPGVSISEQRPPLYAVDRNVIQDVIAFLGGGLFNEIQFAARYVALDAAFALLEREGIANALSSPSIAVLSGEQAQFLVGGEVPIPIAFAPVFGAATQQAVATSTFGVFSSVEFVPFGVQLSIRPLVGDDDSITLDVQPQVVTPDATLTDTIRQTTGANLPTTAFQTRSLRTSSRLEDGQALLIGGLTSITRTSNRSSTPGVRDVPGLGRFFDNSTESDNATDLVVLLNPVILRKPVADAALWAFPTRDELIQPLLGPRAGSGASAAVTR
jgi:Flp pilus assembly secretin CpaC